MTDLQLRSVRRGLDRNDDWVLQDLGSDSSSPRVLAENCQVGLGTEPPLAGVPWYLELDRIGPGGTHGGAIPIGGNVRNPSLDDTRMPGCALLTSGESVVPVSTFTRQYAWPMLLVRMDRTPGGATLPC